MKLEKFNPDQHKLFVFNCLQKRRGDTTPPTLPAHGRVVIADNKLIAAGFLRQVEGGYGQIDGFCTDPEVAGDIRDKALDLLTKQLMDDAREMGIRQLIAITEDKFTLLRSQRHGFKALPSYAVSIASI